MYKTQNFVKNSKILLLSERDRGGFIQEWLGFSNKKSELKGEYEDYTWG